MQKIEQKLASINPDDGSGRLEEYIEGYKKYEALSAAIKLGVFRFLGERGKATRDEIGEALNINGLFVRSFLQSLVEMGVLQQDDDRYANTQISERLFSDESVGYRGDWFNNTGGKISRWSNLVETLTKDAPPADDFNAGPGKEFIRYLAQRCLRGELQAVVKAIVAWEDFPRAKSMLDIGGGHGLFAIALCQENKNLSATIFDKSFVNDYAREYIIASQMDGRVSTRSGDITSDPVDEEYDVVLISHLLYKFRKDLPSIFAKVDRCLKPGGLFVSNHWFCETGCAPGQKGINELDISIHSFGHPLCHLETFYRFYDEQGFSIIAEKDIPTEFGISKLHLAVKGAVKKGPAEPESRKTCSCCD